MDSRKFTSATLKKIPRKAWRIIKNSVDIDYDGTLNDYVVEKVIIPYAEKLGYIREK